MSDKLKELREKQQKLVADARAKLDEITPDVDESRSKEIETEYDAIMADYDKAEADAVREESLIAKERALKEADEHMREVDKSRRPNGDVKPQRAEETDDDKRTAEERHSDAFEAFLRYGSEGMDSEQRKVMSEHRGALKALLGESEARAQAVGTAGAGGALVPEGFMAELVTSMVDYGPMNDGAVVRRINTATGSDMPWPTMDDTSNVGRLIAENAQVTATDITFSTKTLGAYKYSSDLILVSAELLQDSGLDTEAIVRAAMAERIGRILNQHMTTGSGSSQPNGIVTASTLGVQAAESDVITGDEIMDLEHSVDPAYRRAPTCAFMFNDTTLKVIRKLKDGQGNYLWQPADVRAGSPAQLLGHPYHVNQDMNSIGDQSPDDDNRVILFGDMMKYVFRMVRSFAVRRLTERYADYDQVGFVGFTRADGELLDTAAVKHMKMTGSA